MVGRILYLVGQIAVAAILSFLVARRINQQWHLRSVLPGIALLFVLWSIVRATLHLIRYIRNPFQKRHEYFVTGEPIEEYVIEPIVLEGSCVLVFKADIPDTGVKFNLIDAIEESPYVSASYWRAGVDFNVFVGRGIFRLKAKLPKHNARSLRLTLGRQTGPMSAKFTIEIRGHAKAIELPEHAQPLVVRAFPIVPMRAGQSPPSHHL